ncbi:MAG: tetratricopeptide repeat protein [Longimicrobiales bacterium]
MSIEKLKEQARRHEQKEEWQKALDQYKKAIEKLAEEDQPDIGLYNRVGDLFVRVGNLADAVEYYEQAVDLYMEAELPNNAIAVCKKVIRNVPDRYQIYLKMGQIRAQQGFMPDARTNYLTFAERAAQAGEQEESLQALVDFTGLARDDTDMKLFVAEQLIVAERPQEAVDQLVRAHQGLVREGDTAQAATVEARVRELDPSVDLAAAAPDAAGVAAEEELYQFGEIELGGAPEPAQEEPAAAVEAAVEESSPGVVEADDDGVAMDDFQIAGLDDESNDADAEDDAGGVELPLMGFDDDDSADEEEEAVELPTMDFGDDDEDEAVELPTMDFGDDDEDEAVELPTMDFGDDDEDEAVELPIMDLDPADVDAPAESGPDVLRAEDFGIPDGGDRETREYVEGPEEMAEIDVGLEGSIDPEPAEAVAAAHEEAAADDEVSADELRVRITASPDDVALHQRLVEVAYGSGDPALQAEAYLGLAGALSRTGQPAKAKAAYHQVLDVDPTNEAAKAGLDQTGATPPKPVQEVASTEDYVDLGALILGDDEEKTTRFTVAYEEPSGDEDADFAKMLSQFKSKVSENLDADDVRAHHDLGTAYKEMGLLDEAIAEYQQALRASASHLATYELMGQTFMEMGKPDQAIRALERALKVEYGVEDELVGIYYHLARAYEDTNQKEKAVEYYDRVFSLDINFADVTERLRALR